MPVTIVLAVRLIVFFDVHGRVGERVAVMRRQEVHRSPRAACTAIEQVARSGDPRRDLAALPTVAAPEAADAVAETVIPFGESGWMLTELIAARTNIPGFGDQLDARQDRV